MLGAGGYYLLAESKHATPVDNSCRQAPPVKTNNRSTLPELGKHSCAVWGNLINCRKVRSPSSSFEHQEHESHEREHVHRALQEIRVAAGKGDDADGKRHVQ